MTQSYEDPKMPSGGNMPEEPKMPTGNDMPEPPKGNETENKPM